MKIRLFRPVEADVAAIRCILPVEPDDDLPADFPGRTGSLLILTLDVETRKVRDWSRGARFLQLKVRNGGVYVLLDPDGKEIATRRGYVPEGIPNSWHDTIVLDVLGNGTVANWRPTLEALEEGFVGLDWP